MSYESSIPEFEPASVDCREQCLETFFAEKDSHTQAPRWASNHFTLTDHFT